MKLHLRAIVLVLGGLYLISFVIYVIFAPHSLLSEVLINNSGAQITVCIDEKSVFIAPGKSRELPLSIRERPFTVESAGERRYTYIWKPLGQAPTRDHIYWQIEHDYKIYILLHAPEGVEKNLPSQPKGYPLAPQ